MLDALEGSIRIIVGVSDYSQRSDLRKSRKKNGCLQPRLKAVLAGNRQELDVVEISRTREGTEKVNFVNALHSN